MGGLKDADAVSGSPGFYDIASSVDSVDPGDNPIEGVSALEQWLQLFIASRPPRVPGTLDIEIGEDEGGLSADDEAIVVTGQRVIDHHAMEQYAEAFEAYLQLQGLLENYGGAYPGGLPSQEALFGVDDAVLAVIIGAVTLLAAGGMWLYDQLDQAEEGEGFNSEDYEFRGEIGGHDTWLSRDSTADTWDSWQDLDDDGIPDVHWWQDESGTWGQDTRENGGGSPTYLGGPVVVGLG